MANNFSTAGTVGSFQTKPLYTTLVCFFLVFVPYIIVWILCWEFSAPDYGLVAMPTFIQANGKKIISWEVWTIIFSLYGYSLLLPWVLKLITLNHVNIDSSPFIYAIATFSLIFIITWLIPDKDEKTQTLIVIARIVISVTCASIIFFITNKIINYILSNSSIGFQFAIELKKKQVQEDERHQDLKIIRKNSKKEKEFVEIEVEDNKMKKEK